MICYNSYYEKVGNKITDITDEIPFDLPVGWSWCRLDDLGYFGMGQTILTKDMISSGVPVYSATIEDKPLGFIEESSNTVGLKYGDIVIPARGNSIGFVTQINQSSASCTQTTIYHKLFNKELSDWIMSFYKAYKSELFTYTGGAIPQVTVTMIHGHIIPIPPYNEQKRIIKKLRIILDFVDEYKILELEEHKLNTDLPNQLRKSILQYAIQGKLVPQDPNEEPASVLLERIRQEKQQQLGKKSKKNTDSFIYKNSDDNSYYENINGKVVDITDEIPFDLPENWCWCRVGTISECHIGLTYKTTDICEKNGTIVLRSSNIQNAKIDLADIVRVSCDIPQKLFVEENDILICARNGSKKLVGKSALIKKMTEKMSFGAFMVVCKSSIYNYLYTFLQSETFYNQLHKVSGTTTINQLTRDNFNSFFIPIPPLKEQDRIISRMNQFLDYIKK